MYKNPNVANNSSMMKFLKETIYVVLGSLLIAFSIQQFLLPNQLSTGGFAGIGTIVYYFTNAKISVATTIIFLNVPLLLIAYIKLGGKFILKAILGIGLLSIFLNVLEGLKPLTEDKFLACVYGGVIDGIGIAFIFNGSASTGGADLLTSLIRKRRPELRSSNIITVIDTIIVLANVIFFKQIEIGLYSAIAIFIEGKIVDILFEGVNFSKVMLIVSNKSNEISQAIHNEAARGTTGLYGKGMYTNDEKTILMCVVSRNEVVGIRKIAERIDDGAFITIINAREVFGKGFKEDVSLIKQR